MNFFQLANKCKQSSKHSLEYASSQFHLHLDEIAKRYLSSKACWLAIQKPFIFLNCLIHNVAYFFVGALVSVTALFTGNLSAARTAAVSIPGFVSAAALNILNIALSIVSLATRFLVSIFDWIAQNSTGQNKYGEKLSFKFTDNEFEIYYEATSNR
jgi:hypothetical protein